MGIQELIFKNDKDITDKQRDFLNTHEKILSCGYVIGNTLVELAQNLKKMKDEKLFIEAGYSSFEEYTENACGLKQRQAYNYIKILDDLGEDFLNANRNLGVSKLTLLSSLSDNEKELVVQNCEISNVSVSELKQEIEKLKIENAKNVEQLKLFEEKNIRINNKLLVLKDENETLKSQPAQVKVEYVDNPDQQKKIESLEISLSLKEKVIKQRDNQLAELKTNVLCSNSPEFSEFKVLFDEVQFKISRMKQLISVIPSEKQEGCKNALKKVGEMLC